MTFLAAFAPSGNLDPAVIKQFGAAYQDSGESRKAMTGLANERVWEFMGKALALR